MCEKAAAAWRTITAENSKAKLMLHIGGFDDDPRELWEFPEVCAYAPQWAKLVDLDAPEEADEWVAGSCGRGRLARPLTDDELLGNGFSVLSGLGVFGPGFQRRPRRLKPTQRYIDNRGPLPRRAHPRCPRGVRGAVTPMLPRCQNYRHLMMSIIM